MPTYVKVGVYLPVLAGIDSLRDAPGNEGVACEVNPLSC